MEKDYLFDPDTDNEGGVTVKGSTSLSDPPIY